MPQVPQQELAVEEERTSKVEAYLLAFSLPYFHYPSGKFIE
jgi:hypothetical protein